MEGSEEDEVLFLEKHLALSRAGRRRQNEPQCGWGGVLDGDWQAAVMEEGGREVWTEKSCILVRTMLLPPAESVSSLKDSDSPLVLSDALTLTVLYYPYVKTQDSWSVVRKPLWFRRFAFY
ncbi:hypothetical protein R1sor_019804 [Riccia sorocarpa]|uniref:Uncharacterized protein n=1 Tax=Riccia sorocarpa TaxID=122646 RepID=A0ABD3IG98_9MARC